VRAASLIFAGMLLIMIVTQLFSFEKFPDVITTLSLSSDSYSKLWAACIVLFEVAALPFLLSMSLSPAARVVSMFSGWMVTAWWLSLSLWIIGTGHGMGNSGLLGATFSVIGGWWMIFFCIGLGLLSAWASWGMWPRMARKE
jgi:hypothetical protein